GYVDGFADDGLDHLIELRRMSRCDQHPRMVASLLRAQASVDFRRRRGVRTPFAPIMHEIFSDTSPDCSVIDAVRAEFFAYRIHRWVERANAFHVAGIAHVHRRSQRRDAWPGLPNAALQIV